VLNWQRGKTHQLSQLPNGGKESMMSATQIDREEFHPALQALDLEDFEIVVAERVIPIVRGSTNGCTETQRCTKSILCKPQ
jgi:hypothetical protein